MQTKHIVGNPPTSVWQHASDGSGILSVKTPLASVATEPR